MTTETAAMEHVEALCHCLGVEPRQVAHIDIEPWGISIVTYDYDDNGKVLMEIGEFGSLKPKTTRKHFPVMMSMEGVQST